MVPSEPAFVTAPVKVRTPVVEVTVVPEPMVEAPVTVRFVATALSVLAPTVTSVPPTAVVEAMVTVAELNFDTRRLL
jgi:hypothetical protein